MEIIKMPRPIRWIWASFGAYWLSNIIHPGFFSVAIMALLMIPIIIADVFFPPLLPALEKGDNENASSEIIEDEQNPV